MRQDFNQRFIERLHLKPIKFKAMSELHPREVTRKRWPVWTLRLTLGAVLLIFSELVMWQNPPIRQPIEWLALLIVYVALASILLDIVVRFQAREIGSLLLVCGLYGLAQSAASSHNALHDLPISVLLYALGLQTGAALYGFLLFISVMRGKQLNALQALGAAGVGILWGVWVHWYPLQKRIAWGEVSLSTAQLYLVVAWVVLGLLFAFLVPRFGSFRELEFELRWWEMILVGVPLFIALLVGMLQNNVPVLALLALLVLGGIMVYGLSYQRHGYDPSILAELTFASPNLITYLALIVIFLAAGTLSYGLISDMDSVVGIIVYYILLAFGTLWLPGASLLIFWRTLRNRSDPANNAN